MKQLSGRGFKAEFKGVQMSIVNGCGLPGTDLNGHVPH